MHPAALLAQPARMSQAESERYIVASEKQWADAVVSGDTKVFSRVLADDFQGEAEGPGGMRYDKEELISQAKIASTHFLSYRVTEIKITFDGDTATARGVYSWEHRVQGDFDDSPRYGKLFFIHTWKWRNGKWQIVAEKMTGPPTPQKHPPEELDELVRNGEASHCKVVTNPPGAEVYIDGNKGGESPVDLVVLKRGDTPRTITIRMTGYKTVEKQVFPNGKTIPIALTLERNSD
jgi:ketosteroid isomerase-like protein